MPTLPIDVSAIPAIDAHCHPSAALPLIGQMLLDRLSLAMDGHVSALNATKALCSLTVRALADLFGCELILGAVVAARNAASRGDYAAFVRRFFASQHIAALLVDPGCPARRAVDTHFPRRP